MSGYTLSVIKFFNLPHAQVFLTRVTCTLDIRCTKSFMAPMTQMREPKSKDGTGKLEQGNWAEIQNDFLFPVFHLPMARCTATLALRRTTPLHASTLGVTCLCRTHGDSGSNSSYTRACTPQQQPCITEHH